MKTIGITVKGRVQGVSYRQNAKEKARSLGVTGHVRNMPDGNVYIVATGSDEQLRQLMAWCHKGPPAAKVESVEASALPLSSFTSFNILR